MNTNDIQTLAQQIVDTIMADPAHFDMKWWAYVDDVGEFNDLETLLEEYPPQAPIRCDTTLCLAGWATFLYTRQPQAALDREHISFQAQILLGLDGYEAGSVFYKNNWPDPISRAFDEGLPENKAASVALAVAMYRKHGFTLKLPYGTKKLLKDTLTYLKQKESK